MKLDKFTEKSQGAIVAPQNLAQNYQHQLVEPGHLLLALKILSGDFHEGETIQVERGKEGLEFTPAPSNHPWLPNARYQTEQGLPGKILHIMPESYIQPGCSQRLFRLLILE